MYGNLSKIITFHMMKIILKIVYLRRLSDKIIFYGKKSHKFEPN